MKKITVRPIIHAFFATSYALLLSSSLASPAIADTITILDALRNFRDTRSFNDVGVAQGDRDVFGADVSPNTGTTITGIQGNANVGPNLCNGSVAFPNNCSASANFNPNRTGSWNLTFTNGANTAIATTPVLDTTALTLGPVPFPQDVTIKGTGLTPTLSWTVPGGFSPDAVRIQVYDKALTNQRGQDVIVFSTPLPGNQTSFTIPSGILNQNTAYVLNVQLIDTRGHVDFSSNNPALIALRSNSFFDFTPLPPGSQQQAAFLPSVEPSSDPSLGPTYHFKIGSVGPNSVTFIDPFVAVGYDYAIGVGDPNFASVIFPAIQNNPFLLSFAGEPGGNPIQLFANQQFFFPSGGVSQFSVRGINVSNNLDPNNVNAFITGLTFVGDGQFSGTMVPVLQAVSGVPEPESLMLLGFGLLIVTYSARRRRQNQ